MARPDPILDSEAFKRALACVLFEDRRAYFAIVYYLFDGLTFLAIAREMGITPLFAKKLANKAKDILKRELERSRPELLNVSALSDGEMEDLARAEVDEVNRRFPFTKPRALARD